MLHFNNGLVVSEFGLATTALGDLIADGNLHGTFATNEPPSGGGGGGKTPQDLPKRPLQLQPIVRLTAGATSTSTINLAECLRRSPVASPTAESEDLSRVGAFAEVELSEADVAAAAVLKTLGVGLVELWPSLKTPFGRLFSSLATLDRRILTGDISVSDRIQVEAEMISLLILVGSGKFEDISSGNPTGDDEITRQALAVVTVQRGIVRTSTGKASYIVVSD